MHRLFVAVLGLVILTGCTATVAGSASPAPTSAPRPGAVPTMPPAATQSLPDCLIGDTCGQGASPSVEPSSGLDCRTLAAAMTSFDRLAFGGGAARASSTPAEEATLFAVVQETVDQCGYRAVVDIANQYPNPLFAELVADAGAALGEISALPGGLFCYQLQDLGLSAKNAVDYWFYWFGPDNMDADLNGVPCETVWSDARQYVPAWY